MKEVSELELLEQLAGECISLDAELRDGEYCFAMDCVDTFCLYQQPNGRDEDGVFRYRCGFTK